MSSSTDVPITPSARRLNQLSHALGASRYLEIGVETGATFHLVDCEYKTGVDPQFLFDLSSGARLNRHGDCAYYEMASDLFFSRHHNKSEPYDLIFIDGLHHFDQVTRDFVNSIVHAHPRTVFLIDDTLPCDAFSAVRDQQQALELRTRYSVGLQGNAWHGDVYLFVLMLPLYFPAYRYRTLLSPGSNPQTIIWLDPMFAEMNEWVQARSLWAAQNLSACGYTWLLENIDMLQPIEESEGLRIVIDRLGKA
jgi:hypothetical protein